MKNKILVVEDEKMMREALEHKLKKEGFQVLTARDGFDGLHLALLSRPDLILLDILMPRMDGLTMLKKLRKDNWGREVAVMLLTNLNSKDKVAEALEAGMHDYLIKSDWRLEAILKKIKQRLCLANCS